MASKLTVLNDALGHLGELKLAALTEDREARHVLDDKWTGAVKRTLGRGFWNFATRTVQLAESNSLEPAFGLTAAFDKPEDWLRTYRIADNERFEPQLSRFEDRGGGWFADTTELFVEYISSDNEWGFDLGKWPQSFEDTVALDLAVAACFRITGSDSRVANLEKMVKKSLATARSEDAMNEPPGQFPLNSWVTSRGDNSLQRSRWDRRS